MRNLKSSLMLTVFALLAAIATGFTGVQPAVAQAEEYEVDPAHTFVIFNSLHMGAGYTFGRFNDISGSFTVDEENPGNSSVSLTIDAASVDTGVEQRDEHLRSPDFLNAQQFPEITFESTEITEDGENAYTVTGDLTLHGNTNEIDIEVTKTGEGEDPEGNFRTGWLGTVTINRSNYGMDFGIEEGIAGDQIALTISVEGIRQ